MTAWETIRKFWINKYGDSYAGDAKITPLDFEFKAHHEDFLTEAMKEYAKEKCREQRELCDKNSDIEDVHDPDLNVLSKSILEAPEPIYD